MLKMFALVIGTCAIFWIFLLNECKIMIGSILHTGFPQALEIMENLKNHAKKFHARKKHGILWNNLMKLPEAIKLPVRHTKLVCLTATFLATGGFKF